MLGTEPGREKVGTMKRSLAQAVGLTVLFCAGLARAGEDEERRAAIAAKVEKGMNSPLAGETEHPEEFETKHIFGVSEGTDVGEPGEKEVEFSTNANIGKHGGGRYGGVEQEAAFEHAVTDRFGYEFSLHGVSMTMTGVPGVANQSLTTFSGLSFAPKLILLRRGVDAPIGLAVSMAPEYDRVDPVIGAQARNFALPFKLMMDAELIKEKLFFGTNIVLAPEWDNEKGYGFSQYALFGLTGALTYRLTPKIAIGGQVEYYNVYGSLGFANNTGWGTYLGPTVHMQINDKSFVAASWSSQVAGQPAYGSAATLSAYNASDLARNRATLIFGLQF